MAHDSVMVDTTVLIDYFRKTNKEGTKLFKHAAAGRKIFVSAVTEFEILNGAKEVHRLFWEQMRVFIEVLPFDSKAAQRSAAIVAELKPKRKNIDKPDLFIAATASENGLPLDTHNTRHFQAIDSLTLFQ